MNQKIIYLFFGYVFDHRLPANTIVTNLTSEQKEVIESKKNYHILATYSFNDEVIIYQPPALSYYNYYKEYTNFKFYSFGELNHNFEKQPIFSEVKMWLKERMGK